jgi:predicted LPLAT superfamily acyltransferase
MQGKQRGSGWSIALVYNLYKIFGYNFIYYLMYPVTFFYFLFAGNVKKALKNYYEHINLPFNNKIYYNHLRIFAICMVDRFISQVSPHSYSFTYENEDEVTDVLESGSIILVSHYGGWATASNLCHVTNKVNIVMKEILLKEIKSIEESIAQRKDTTCIIDLNEGGISSSVKIANALLNEEIVAMMADRVIDEKHIKKIKFFDKEAGFNKNPFQIAYKLDKPIMLLLVINKGKQLYKIAHLKIDMDHNLKEEEAIQKAMEQYVNFLENILKEDPNQWFNFYDFWGE